MSEMPLYNRYKVFFSFRHWIPQKLQTKPRLLEKKWKWNRVTFPTRPSIPSSPSSARLHPFPSYIQALALFFSESHFSLMDVLSAGGFWFRLLTPPASPNIHFRCGGSITLISLKMKLWLNAPLLAVEGLRVSPLHMKEDAPCAWVDNDVRPVN